MPEIRPPAHMPRGQGGAVHPVAENPFMCLRMGHCGRPANHRTPSQPLFFRGGEITQGWGHYYSAVASVPCPGELERGEWAPGEWVPSAHQASLSTWPCQFLLPSVGSFRNEHPNPGHTTSSPPRRFNAPPCSVCEGQRAWSLILAGSRSRPRTRGGTASSPGDAD